MKPIAKELKNAEDGFLNGARYLIMDRDDKFCESFRRGLQDENVQPLLLQPRSPNLNAHLERFFGSLKSECLDRMIFFGEQSLRTAVRVCLWHYHGERNHQGLDNKIPIPSADLNQATGPIDCPERLGGLLRYYHRRAA
jgi:transposase InsO family protein